MIWVISIIAGVVALCFVYKLGYRDGYAVGHHVGFQNGFNAYDLTPVTTYDEAHAPGTMCTLPIKTDGLDPTETLNTHFYYTGECSHNDKVCWAERDGFLTLGTDTSPSWKIVAITDDIHHHGPLPT